MNIGVIEMNVTENIKGWDYDYLVNQLPKGESDSLEFKSGRVSLDDLKNKISVAASSFWNSGGGIFIAGVDDDGKLDGGIPKSKGRQSIRDWADKAVGLTVPSGSYQIQVIEHDDDTNLIDVDKVVLVIQFWESTNAPHMAYDNRYYIRAGAHSGSATHFQIEALRALRQYSKPNIMGVMRYHPTKPRIEEVVIVALNDAPAIDVSLSFEPLPKSFAEHFQNHFPICIPVVNKENEFRMEVSGFGFREQVFGKEPVELVLNYKDVLGNVFSTRQTISPQKNLQPMAIGEDINTQLVKAIEGLAKKIK